MDGYSSISEIAQKAWHLSIGVRMEADEPASATGAEMATNAVSSSSVAGADDKARVQENPRW